MSEGRCFRKSKTVVERRIRGEHILVPVAGTMEQLDSIYTLNPAGSLVWERAIGGTSETEIVRALTAEFDVDAGTASRDAARHLDELCALGALEPVEG